MRRWAGVQVAGKGKAEILATGGFPENGGGKTKLVDAFFPPSGSNDHTLTMTYIEIYRHISVTYISYPVGGR